MKIFENRLLILTPDAEAYVRLLNHLQLPDLALVSCGRKEDALDLIADCNIVLGQPDWVRPILDHAPKLKWVQSTFAGVEALCMGEPPSGYMLTGVKGLFGPLMSEYVFAYILALERQLFETRDNQKKKLWRMLPYQSLHGLNLGICGLGSVGRQIARTGNHFNMRVLAYKRSPQESPLVEQVFSGPSLNDFIGRLDYLVITLPLTGETRCLMDYETLCHMKPSAVMINVGRGGVVVEQDLERILEEKRIRGAVIDVFEKEPLDAQSRLWAMPQVFITPHNSAFSFPEKIVEIFSDNYRRFLNKEKLKYLIDFKRGY